MGPRKLDLMFVGGPGISTFGDYREQEVKEHRVRGLASLSLPGHFYGIVISSPDASEVSGLILGGSLARLSLEEAVIVPYSTGTQVRVKHLGVGNWPSESLFNPQPVSRDCSLLYAFTASDLGIIP